MPTIDTLLSLRNTRRNMVTGDVQRAETRINVSKFLADNFLSFDKLRLHLIHPEHYKTLKQTKNLNIVIDYLVELKWIKQTGKNKWGIISQPKIRNYLAGGWLEELLYFAHLEAGTDEAYFGQVIEWEVDGIKGKNEIDVIARRGDVLSFTSCKAMSARKNTNHLGHLRNFLTETDYWNIHFANDKGRALLVVTADLIDEVKNSKHRYPSLLARASILDVSVAGLESVKWNKVVQAVKAHW